jgi:hypothetical protein
MKRNKWLEFAFVNSFRFIFYFGFIFSLLWLNNSFGIWDILHVKNFHVFTWVVGSMFGICFFMPFTPVADFLRLLERIKEKMG